MANEDPGHLTIIRARPCRLASGGLCLGVVAPHHPTRFRDTGHDKRRAHDRYAIPLCHRHHVAELHGHVGYFKGWTGDEMHAWEIAQLAAMPAYVPQPESF